MLSFGLLGSLVDKQLYFTVLFINKICINYIHIYPSHYMQGDVLLQIYYKAIEPPIAARILSHPWLNSRGGRLNSVRVYPPRKLWGVFLPLSQLTFIKGATTVLVRLAWIEAFKPSEFGTARWPGWRCRSTPSLLISLFTEVLPFYHHRRLEKGERRRSTRSVKEQELDQELPPWSMPSLTK